MISKLNQNISSHTAAFYTNCSFCTTFKGSPMQPILQQFNLDSTKASNSGKSSYSGNSAVDNLCESFYSSPSAVSQALRVKR